MKSQSGERQRQTRPFGRQAGGAGGGQAPSDDDRGERADRQCRRRWSTLHGNAIFSQMPTPPTLHVTSCCIILLILAAGLLGGCATPAAPAGGAARPASPDSGPAIGIQAGAAVRVFTPPVGPGAPPVRIAGFGQGRDATGVHDDLTARALVIETGGTTVALVALDLIGFFHDDVVKIRAEVRDRHPEVGVRSILVASTHTHAGPDVIGLWSPPERRVDPAYVARIRAAAADAVAEAWNRRRPARLSFASADAADLIHDSRLPEVIDPTAFLMRVEGAAGAEPIATLLSFPSHPESLGRTNTLISADYPWAARLLLEKEFGGVSVFFSGDLGGMLTPSGVSMTDPRTGDTLTAGTPRATQVYGEVLAQRVIDAWRAGAAAAPPDARFELQSRAIDVPLANERFRAGLASGQIWPRAVAADGGLESEVAVLTVRGGADDAEPLAQLACMPGEIYPELVVGGIQSPQDPGADVQGAAPERPLREMMRGRFRPILGLCNDELGYIIPRSEWDEAPPWAYGRTGPQYGEINSTGPMAAPTVLGAFAGILGAR